MALFRPSLRHYLFYVILFLLFVPVLIALVWGFFQGHIPTPILLICGFWSVFFVGPAVVNVYRLRRTKVMMDEEHFYAQFGRESFNIAWKDVLMIRMIEEYLEVATESDLNFIHLKDLNSQLIWEHAQQYAPPSAIDQDAFLSVPAYQQTIADYQALLQEETLSLRADYPRSTQIKRSLLFIVFLLPGILLLFDDSMESLLPIIYSVFVLLVAGGYTLQSLGTFEVTPDKVVVNKGFLRSELHWDEIERIKAGLLYKNLAFYGQRERLIVPGLLIWGQKNEKVYKMICAQAWKHQIKLEDSNRRDPLFLLNNLPSP